MQQTEGEGGTMRDEVDTNAMAAEGVGTPDPPAGGLVPSPVGRKHRSEPDYIDRTIATVRNHREADNCWPQWANIFADEIEDLRSDVAELEARATQAEAVRNQQAVALMAGDEEMARLREERDAALRGNWQAEPDAEGGKSESYWLRNKLRSAVVHLRDVEDFYRVRSSRLGSHNDERANRARGIYEQISEAFINGKLGTPTMRERAEAAEARCAELAEQGRIAAKRYGEEVERCARLQQALAGLESAVRILDVMLREPAAEGLMSAEDYRSYVQGAWLGVDEAAEKARDALAGLDMVENRLPADSRPPGWVCDREDCQGRPAEIVARATQAEVVERLVPKHVRDAIGYAEEGRASHVAWAEHLDAGTCEFCTNDVVDTAGDAAHQREWVAKYDAILAVLREYADRVAASRLLDSIARISDEVNHERRVAAVQHALRYRAEAAHLLSLLATPADSPPPRSEYGGEPWGAPADSQPEEPTT